MTDPGSPSTGGGDLGPFFSNTNVNPGLGGPVFPAEPQVLASGGLFPFLISSPRLFGDPSLSPSAPSPIIPLWSASPASQSGTPPLFSFYAGPPRLSPPSGSSPTASPRHRILLPPSIKEEEEPDTRPSDLELSPNMAKLKAELDSFRISKEKELRALSFSLDGGSVSHPKPVTIGAAGTRGQGSSSSSSSSVGGNTAAAGGTVKQESPKKKRRPHSETAKTILQDWLMLNVRKPYPSPTEKESLARQTGLTVNQVNNWFVNARRRKLRPAAALLAAQAQISPSMGTHSTPAGAFRSSPSDFPDDMNL